jgi:hypothetical protein
MVRRIALAARPEMIIDNKGRIEIDRGAMDYIADIKVTQNPEFPHIADTIVVPLNATWRIRRWSRPLKVASEAKTEHGQKLD